MPNVIEILAGTVIFLFSVGPNPQPIGTGFIVGFPVPNKEMQFIPIIVTAKHVIGDQSEILGRFSTKIGDSTAMIRYNIAKLKESNDYWEHPDDEGVDIVAFRSYHFENTKYNVVPIEAIATKKIFDDIEIQQTDRIIFPSLLINFMGSLMNYPVFRDGTIALIPEEKIPMKYKIGSKLIDTKQEVILVDATSVPGASGSPIFLWPGPRIVGGAFSIGGNRPYLLGIMHGFYPAMPREVYEVETSESKTMYSENSGIAIIFPSWKLLDILNHKKFKDRMNDILGLQNTH